MTDEDNSPWNSMIEELANLKQNRELLPSEVREASSRIRRRRVLLHVGVSLEHVKRMEELVVVIEEKRLMNTANVHRWAYDHLYRHHMMGHPITEETFIDLLKKAGVTS